MQRCLNALLAQKDVEEMEIIVPYDDRMKDASELQKTFPEVRFVKHPGKRTYAELRSTGFQNASNAVIALTEDQCIPDPDWCSSILQAHAASHAAAGGAVEKGFDASRSSDSVLNWSVYFCDYSRYVNPVTEGAAGNLTDCNVSYKREALHSISQLSEQEFHETVVHGALLKRGEHLWLSPRIVVRQQRNLAFRQAVRERCAFGRLFGSTRVANASRPKRGFYALASFLLPFVLTARIAKNLFIKKRYRLQFLRCLPWIIVLNLAWSYGEFLGYCTARPDSSLRPRQISA